MSDSDDYSPWTGKSRRHSPARSPGRHHSRSRSRDRHRHRQYSPGAARSPKIQGPRYFRQTRIDRSVQKYASPALLNPPSRQPVMTDGSSKASIDQSIKTYAPPALPKQPNRQPVATDGSFKTSIDHPVKKYASPALLKQPGRPQSDMNNSSFTSSTDSSYALGADTPEATPRMSPVSPPLPTADDIDYMFRVEALPDPRKTKSLPKKDTKRVLVPVGMAAPGGMAYTNDADDDVDDDVDMDNGGHFVSAPPSAQPPKPYWTSTPQMGRKRQLDQAAMDGLTADQATGSYRRMGAQHSATPDVSRVARRVDNDQPGHQRRPKGPSSSGSHQRQTYSLPVDANQAAPTTGPMLGGTGHGRPAYSPRRAPFYTKPRQGLGHLPGDTSPPPSHQARSGSAARPVGTTYVDNKGALKETYAISIRDHFKTLIHDNMATRKGTITCSYDELSAVADDSLTHIAKELCERGWVSDLANII